MDVSGIDIAELLVYYSSMQVEPDVSQSRRLQTLETGACAGDKRVVVHDKGAELKHYNEKHKRNTRLRSRYLKGP